MRQPPRAARPPPDPPVRGDGLLAALGALPATARAHEFTFTTCASTCERTGRSRPTSAATSTRSRSASPRAPTRRPSRPRSRRCPRPSATCSWPGSTLLTRRLRVRFDGEPVPFEVTLPERGNPTPEGLPSALGLVARLSGRVPAGAREVTFFASRAFPPCASRSSARARPRAHADRAARRREPPARADRAVRHGSRETLRASSTSASTTSCPTASTTCSSSWPRPPQRPARTPARPGHGLHPGPHPDPRPLDLRGPEPSPARGRAADRALHRLRGRRERGLAAPAALSRRARLRVRPPARPGLRGRPGRDGPPRPRHLLALLAFNVGVELGQLAVIALSAGPRPVGSPRAERRAARGPASLAIAAIGLFWTVERRSASEPAAPVPGRA